MSELVLRQKCKHERSKPHRIDRMLSPSDSANHCPGSFEQVLDPDKVLMTWPVPVEARFTVSNTGQTATAHGTTHASITVADLLAALDKETP